MPSSLPFDRVADRYDTTRGGAPRGRHTAAAFERWLPGGPIVELGVGTGVISAALTDERRRPVGLDLSAPMLVNAAERLPGRLAQGDVLSPPVRHGAVAAVIAVHVLHLVTDLGAAVGAAASLLRAGGRFLISGIDGNRESDDELAAIDAALPVRLRPIRQPQGAEIIELGRTHGLVLLHDGRMPRRTFTQSPANAADLLETRAWSWCWDLPDDVWTAEVVPVIEALRALPEAHRPRQRWVEWRYLVLEATPPPP